MNKGTSVPLIAILAACTTPTPDAAPDASAPPDASGVTVDAPGPDAGTASDSGAPDAVYWCTEMACSPGYACDCNGVCQEGGSPCLAPVDAGTPDAHVFGLPDAHYCVNSSECYGDWVCDCMGICRDSTEACEPADAGGACVFDGDCSGPGLNPVCCGGTCARPADCAGGP